MGAFPLVVDSVGEPVHVYPLGHRLRRDVAAEGRRHTGGFAGLRAIDPGHRRLAAEGAQLLYLLLLRQMVPPGLGQVYGPYLQEGRGQPGDRDETSSRLHDPAPHPHRGCRRRHAAAPLCMGASGLGGRLRCSERCAIRCPAAQGMCSLQEALHLSGQRGEVERQTKTMIIQVQDLVKRYGDVVAVDGLSFEVERGEIFGMLGPNGAGKTTTIRVIMDILQPDEGTVRVLGQPPGQANAQIGYLPEERGLYRNLKVLDNLVYLAELKGVPRPTARERSRELLERIQLEEWASRKVRDLSQGMQQRLQFVASLVHDPEVLFLDEPFQGLDPVNVERVKDLMTELHR
ncbi:MAG TPA: ATP-binding cassette domain-containing protein, partial [Anaerolineae bacterium]|nr:ATP-binding cassette domain-containing protein [Anaerolineae bacterium]